MKVMVTVFIIIACVHDIAWAHIDLSICLSLGSITQIIIIRDCWFLFTILFVSRCFDAL